MNRNGEYIFPLQEHEPAENGLSFYEKEPVVFGAIYFGCRMLSEDKSSLGEIVRRKYPHMKIFEAKKSSTSFSLKFDEIN